MFLFFKPSFLQKKVLEGLQVQFNENKTSELHNSEISEKKKKIKNAS